MVVELDDVRLAVLKSARSTVRKSSSGGSSDHSANTPPGRSRRRIEAQPLDGVEAGMAGVQHVPRAVVDVDEQRVERGPAAPASATPEPDVAKKSPATSRQRGSAVSPADTGSSPRSCQPTTSASASSTTSEPTRGSSSAVTAV